MAYEKHLDLRFYTPSQFSLHLCFVSVSLSPSFLKCYFIEVIVSYKVLHS